MAAQWVINNYLEFRLMCEGGCIYLSKMSRVPPVPLKSVYMRGMKIFNESSIRRKEVFGILQVWFLI